MDHKSLTPASIIHCEAWLHRLQKSHGLVAPAKNRRVSTRVAANVVGNLADQLVQAQHEKDIEDIVHILKAQPHNIIMCKAFLRSDISDSTSLGCFKRGVVSLETVQEKHTQPILCQAFAGKADDFVRFLH